MDAIQTADKPVQCHLSVFIGLSGLRLRFYGKWPPDVANVTFIFKLSVQSHQTLCVIYA